jgi:type I restriction enzyme S subunit
MSYLMKLLEGVEVEWKPLAHKENGVVELSRGRVMSKEYLAENAGKYPVYSSQTANNGEIGMITSFDYDGEFITWTTDGANAGTVFHRTGKFSITNVCGLIKVKDIKLLNYKFLFYWLSIEAKKYVYSGMGNPKLMSNQMAKIPIPVPPLSIQKVIVLILDNLTELTAALTAELKAELTARKNQYTFYREQLFSCYEPAVARVSLGIIGAFQRGKRFVKDDMLSEGVPCIHYGEMYTYYGTWAKKSKSFLSEELVERKNLRIAENGDVVIVAAGETIEDIGKGTAWLGDEGIVIHDACFSFRSILNPKYVAYFTRTKQFHDQIKKHISSGKISAINARGLEKVLIPVPSPEEQERIVTILDKFDILTTSISEGLPKEIELRKKQYEYYRDLLLTFPKNNIES